MLRGCAVNDALHTNIHYDVRYEFVCETLADEFIVTGFECVETLNEPYRLTVHLHAVHEATDATELLGRDTVFLVDREAHRRIFHGIVARVTVHDDAVHERSTVEIVPALEALRLTVNTRIFQDVSAIEVVETVLAEGLAPYQRTVDTTALDRERYLERDYCVQYREPSLDFVQRLLEEEGVGYYFQHPADGPEVMVLFDDNADLARVETLDHGPVRFGLADAGWSRAELILRFDTSLALTPSRVTVRDLDWTRARSRVEADAEVDVRPSQQRHGHEIYEHGFARSTAIREDHGALAAMVDALNRAVMPHGPPIGMAYGVVDFPGGVFERFTSHDAVHQATIRAQRLQSGARVARGAGLATRFAPGLTFQLLGHPSLGTDGEYVITSVRHRSRRSHDVGDVTAGVREARSYENEFECLPQGTPWRPARRARKPRIYGVQTATVTAPMGMDVHTDQHGRIKARFQWDRATDDPAGNYTCWLRVSQTWAGQGAPAFLFIPRVGMEVVVSFVDGDPDRPLVTGCVYNGQNPTPGLLPAQATKSIIRTRTVPHGPGHNEISFEDAMGMERLHIRAERDLDELVRANHTTSVHRHQRNEVFGDRFGIFHRDHSVNVGANSRTRIRGDSILTVRGAYTTQIGGAFRLIPQSDLQIMANRGSILATLGRGAFLVHGAGLVKLQNDPEQWILMTPSDHPSGRGIELKCGESTLRITSEGIVLSHGSSQLEVFDGYIRVNNKVHPA